MTSVDYINPFVNHTETERRHVWPVQKPVSSFIPPFVEGELQNQAIDVLNHSLGSTKSPAVIEQTQE